MAVVVCHIGGFNRSIADDVDIFRRSLEGIGLVCPNRLSGQRTLQIDHCQIIVTEDILHILQEIIRSVLIVVRIHTGAVVKIFVCTEGHIADKAHLQIRRCDLCGRIRRHRLRICHYDFGTRCYPGT